MTTQGMPVGLQLGFANEFFTLWRVDAPNENGRQIAYFLGNVSKSREDAIGKYPNLPISALKGVEFTWTPSPKDDGTSEVFIFGKYSGQQISDCADFKYIHWYWSQTHNTNAFSCLTGAGYVFGDGLLFASQSDFDSHQQMIAIETMLLTDGTYTVECVSNISICNDGENINLSIKVNVNLDLHREHFPWGQSLEVSNLIPVSVRSYSGFDYAVLPGVKSMKGKTFVIVIANGKVQEFKKI